MNENNLIEDRINLFEVFKTLLNGKWIIIIITLMFSLIGYGYHKTNPTNFKITFKILSPEPIMFTNFIDLNKLLKENNINYSVNPKKVTELFLNEFYDYQELIYVLNTTPSLQTELKKLNKKEKKEILIQYSKLFNINAHLKKNNLHIASVNWGNVEEAKNIFNKALILTLNNVKKQINKDVDQLVEIIRKSRFKKILKEEEEEKKYIQISIEYLEEQFQIAKKLNFKDTQSNIISSYQHKPTNFSLSLKSPSETLDATLNATTDATARFAVNNLYYLLGYEAIALQINALSKRLDKQNLLIKNIEIEKNNKFMKSEENFLKSNIDNWVIYDLSLADVVDQKMSSVFIPISAVLGFILSIFYVLILNAFREYKNKS